MAKPGCCCCRHCCCFPSIAEIMERCGCGSGIVAQKVCCDAIVRRCCGCCPKCGCRRNCCR